MKVQIIEEMIGKTLCAYITKAEYLSNYTLLEFHTKEGDSFTFYHDQDCCESVYIDDICGDLDDLLGSPILRAEARISLNETPLKETEYMDDSNTWTFYEFATIKGSVTVRWWGSSNGYYSESVNCRVTKDDKLITEYYGWDMEE